MKVSSCKIPVSPLHRLQVTLLQPVTAALIKWVLCLRSFCSLLYPDLCLQPSRNIYSDFGFWSLSNQGLEWVSDSGNFCCTQMSKTFIVPLWGMAPEEMKRNEITDKLCFREDDGHTCYSLLCSIMEIPWSWWGNQLSNHKCTLTALPCSTQLYIACSVPEAIILYLHCMKWWGGELGIDRMSHLQFRHIRPVLYSINWLSINYEIKFKVLYLCSWHIISSSTLKDHLSSKMKATVTSFAFLAQRSSVITVKFNCMSPRAFSGAGSKPVNFNIQTITDLTIFHSKVQSAFLTLPLC